MDDPYSLVTPDPMVGDSIDEQG
ncbi:uncharacterized protein G2W53_042741 [Senna tora]|uniref:Uncharacterized protein n=1 Tax=Senna tora TaxID=362788 RepID=A0A834W044_9FABA|nr:uncharacterized protein G2W53_042741 [Senna tora]